MCKKWLYKSTLLFVFFALTVMQGSSNEDFYYEYYAVYMDRENLEKSISYIKGGKEMKNPGKIYYKHPYLFVNERYKGVHIFDNSDPTKPEPIGFIVAPGCLDMAIKDNIIYLDNSVDLVAFDWKKMEEMKRIPGIFPEPACPDNSSAWYDYDRREGLIIVEWLTRKTTYQ